MSKSHNQMTTRIGVKIDTVILQVIAVSCDPVKIYALIIYR
jgi:hypothetical protein